MTVKEMLENARNKSHASFAVERAGDAIARPLWAIAALLTLDLAQQGVLLPQDDKQGGGKKCGATNSSD